MKIAILTENNYAGGLDTFITNLINYWPDDDDELVLICNDSHPGLEIIQAHLTRPCEIVAHSFALQWVFVRRLAGLPGAIRKPISAALKYIFLLTYVPKIGQILRRANPDRLLIVNGGYPGGDTLRAAAIFWGRSRGRVPSIHNFHNLAFPPRWWERWIENRIDALVERYSKAIISTSNASAQTIRLRPSMKESEKIGFIHNGTEGPPDPDSSRARFRDTLGIPPDSPLIAMLGTYEARKGHRFLLEAFARVRSSLPNAHLVITGYGQDHEIALVESYVDELGLAGVAHLEGFSIDRHELMAETDVVVVSSQQFESFGLTLVEAMSHKIPVVSTRIGGTPEVMNEDEGGFSVETHDMEGFADSITLLLTDKDVYREKSEGGYRRYQDYFTIGRMAQDYARMLHDDGTS